MMPVIIGNATLYLADCRDVLPLIPDSSIRMMWTDPPYGHNNGQGDFLASRLDILGDHIKSRVTAIANDSAHDMRAVVDFALSQAARFLTRDSCCCCCCCCGGGGPSPTFAWVAQRMDTDGMSFFHSVIWDKINPGIGWRYRRQHEMVMVAHRADGKISWPDKDALQPNIIRMSKPRTLEHPNEKPVALVEKFIHLHSSDGDTVIDPFMGSGTTGVAALRLNRKFIGIELDAAHFATAVERISAVNAQGSLL